MTDNDKLDKDQLMKEFENLKPEQKAYYARKYDAERKLKEFDK